MSCAKPSQATSPARAGRRICIGLCRLALVAAAFLTLVPRGSREVGADPDRLLAEAREIAAEVVGLGGERDGFHELLDARGDACGWVTSTLPHAAGIRGYNGPSELVVVLDTVGQVRGVRLMESADTEGHVKKILRDARFWQQWTGKSETQLGDLGSPQIVSGATLTSEAMARGVAARFGAKGMDEWFTKPITAETVSRWFPGADRVEVGRDASVSRVFAAEKELGLVLRSTRMGVGARGFNGVSDVLIAVEGNVVKGVGLLDSRDNQPYVGDVMDELRFADGFAGRSIPDILAAPESDGLVVSGASVTANAVISSVREMLRRHVADPPHATWSWSILVASVWIAGGLVIGLRRRWSGRRVRVGFAIASVGSGLAFGWMVGQDQLVGWVRNGVDVSHALPLVLLTAVALLVPALTGKNIYCSRICPHGAAQTLAGMVVKRRFALPPRVHRVLQRVPWLTLLAIWGIAMAGNGIPLAMLEPFEVWSVGFYAVLPAAILSVGLLVACFLPQGYCHYGCPTGALLIFLTHSPGNFTRRDAIATGLIAAAWLYTYFS